MNHELTDRPRRQQAIRPGLFCLAAALLLSAWVWTTAEDTYWLSHRGEVTTATVISNEPQRNGGTTLTVSFTTLTGFKTTSDTSNHHYTGVGKTIEIRYDREYPDRMQSADWGSDYRQPIILGGAAALALLIGAALIIGRRVD